MDRRKIKPKLGIAWIILSFSLAIHVADEAFNDFLQVYNPIVINIREYIPFLPIPIFTVKLWLTGLIIFILLLFILSPYAFRSSDWIIKVSLVYSIVMLINGIIHILGSLFLGSLIPSVYSSPLLIFASIYLLWNAKNLKTKQ